MKTLGRVLKHTFQILKLNAFLIKSIKYMLYIYKHFLYLII